jgi:4-amino-4-deoxy-L-arabinose transferase-like glycosyltransferase
MAVLILFEPVRGNVQRRDMTQAQSLTVVPLIWAAIYLPALGALPIKGEEGRRILPAISMIESGNYLVPQVGGEAYFRKPPLINWLVAISFKIFGRRNEWAARFPSALSLLAVALAFVTVARPSLGPRGSGFAAVIWLTTAGLIEKGRLAEIEALYVSLSALAFIFWLSSVDRQNSAWVIWMPASLFLGLGWLAKGPIHLIFFYAVVGAVLWQNRNWRLLIHPAHLLGLLIMFGIFAAWAIPFALATGTSLAAGKWSSQFTGRLHATDFKFASWVWNIPRGLVYFLPWTILLPLVRPEAFSVMKERRLAQALVWASAGPFIIINLVPGSLPRYAMPAIAPASWLLAMTLSIENVSWPHWLGGKAFPRQARQQLVAGVAVLVCAGMAVYAAVVVPRLEARGGLKQLAAKIDAAVPASEPVYALDPNYQPVFFYLRSKLIYAAELKDLPSTAAFVLVRPKNERQLLDSNQWTPRHPRLLFRASDYRGESIALFRIQ